MQGKRRNDSHIYIHNGAYVAMTGPTARSHPARTSTGWVQLHTMAAYDKYGPGPHPCHWCGRQVDWYFRTFAKDNPIKKIVVDHLNWVTIDCRSENLVVSCNSCNTQRSRDEVSPRDRSLQVNQSFGRCTGCDRDFKSRMAYRGHRRSCKSGSYQLISSSYVSINAPVAQRQSSRLQEK